MAGTNDTDFMKMAFELAEKGRGRTSPNPVVGAVIVRNNRVIGKGYHRAIGREHAEVAAIKMAGSRSRGAILYVNLEPCCHYGRTGPCTESIIKAGISRVVLSIKDPNPLVNGQGIRQLRQAKITVETGLLKAEARRLNEIYLAYYEKKRPFIILKLAQSLDGRIATNTGDSRWISSPPARRFVHRLRSEVDAVVVGAGTVRRDNPSLTVRQIKGNSPYRVILSESFDIPTRSNLLVKNDDFKTIVALPSAAMKKSSNLTSGRHPIIWTVRREGKNRLDLNDFIAKADMFGLRSILVEGGAKLATAFLKANLIDKIVVITAPLILGQGISGIGELGIEKISEAIRLDRCHVFSVGPDSVFVGYPQGVK